MSVPSMPPPSSPEDAIAQLTTEGNDIKLTVNTMEANPHWFGHARSLAKAHRLLNEAGYLLEEICGVPDGTFGAGGTNKGGGGGG